MNNKLNLKILIPTYRRAKIFKHTLDSLFDTIDESIFNVEIHIGILADDIETMEYYIQRKKNPNVGFTSCKFYRTNIGKAKCLNDLFNTYCWHDDTDFVLTLDNDIVFYQPWLKHIETVVSTTYMLKWDFFTFSGKNCFMTMPDNLEQMTFIADYQYKSEIYNIRWAMAQGGGMVLYPYLWLDDHPFESIGDGVYLGEDEAHCRATNRRYVLYHDSDWIRHDPHADLYPEYKQYYEKKTKQIEEGNYYFAPDWDK